MAPPATAAGQPAGWHDKTGSGAVGNIPLPSLSESRDSRSAWLIARHLRNSAGRSSSPSSEGSDEATGSSAFGSPPPQISPRSERLPTTAHTFPAFLPPKPQEPNAFVSPPGLLPAAPSLVVSAVAVPTVPPPSYLSTIRTMARPSDDGARQADGGGGGVGGGGDKRRGGSVDAATRVKGSLVPAVVFTAMAVVYTVMLLGVFSIVCSQFLHTTVNPYGFFKGLVPGSVRHQFVRVQLVNDPRGVGSNALLLTATTAAADGSGGGVGKSALVKLVDGAAAAGASAQGFVPLVLSEEELRAARAASAVGSWHHLKTAEVASEQPAGAASNGRRALLSELGEDGGGGDGFVIEREGNDAAAARRAATGVWGWMRTGPARRALAGSGARMA